MCKLCGHAYGDHWREDNKCAVKDCPCPGYEKPDEEKAAGKKQLTTWHWSIALAALTSPLFFCSIPSENRELDVRLGCQP